MYPYRDPDDRPTAAELAREEDPQWQAEEEHAMRRLATKQRQLRAARQAAEREAS